MIKKIPFSFWLAIQLFATTFAFAQQFTINWGQIGFSENDNIPTAIDTYIDNVNYEDNPYHGFGDASGDMTGWLSQTFTNLEGSGVDMTLYFSPNSYDGNSASSLEGPDLYKGDFPDAKVLSDTMLRMVNDKIGDVTPFTAVVSFSKPILMDEFLVGSLSKISGNFENVVVRAFSGPEATGSTVAASTYLNISDLTDDSSLLHGQGVASDPPSNSAIGNAAIDPSTPNNTYHVVGIGGQNNSRYGRAKLAWNQPIQTIAVSTWKTGSSSFADKTYENSAHSMTFAPFTFTPVVLECALEIEKIEEVNCTGTNEATLDVTINWANAPTGENIIVTLDGSSPQTIVPATSNGSDVVAFTVAADGSMNHEIIAQFVTSSSCGDTTEIKYPLPCPSDVTVNCSSGIGGNVFTDYNYNGLDDDGGIGIGGVEVTAYDTNGTIIASAYTDSDGEYQLNVAAGAYRVEFNLPDVLACYLKPTTATTVSSGSSIQFITAPNCANLALANPSDYCQTEPALVTACYVEGDAPASPALDVLVSVPYTASGSSVQHQYEAVHTQLGTTWGLAYQRSSKTLFASAYQKRHTAYGTANSTGAIYKLPNPNDGATTGVALFLDLNVLYGSNITGDNPHPNGGDFYNDDASYDKVGKIAIGDMDISDDEKYLWLTNLKDRKLYQIPLGNDVKNPTPPTSTSEINTYPLYDICDCDGDGQKDTEADSDLRPFAVKYHKGKIYIGLVCSGESTPANFNNLNAKAFVFDPIAKTFEEVLSFPLTYDRGCGIVSHCVWRVNPPPYSAGNTANWRPWDDTYDQDELSWYDASFREGGYPQPMFSDIEFDEQGNMIIGLRDRYGDMVGDGLPEPNGTILLESDGVGDILKATVSTNGWTLNITQATDGTEFFAQDNYSGHDETSMGGVTVVLGTQQAIYSVMDPITNLSGGFDWVNTTTGTLNQSYQIYRRPSGGAGSSELFAKANGLGDVEALCDPAPIEIGNYVWKDSNENGIQDAGEQGIENVRVTIFNKNCDSLATVLTDNKGEYYFNDSIIKASTYTADTALLADTVYYLVLGINQFNTGDAILNDSLQLTLVDNAGTDSNADKLDSDATIGTADCYNGYPYITAKTAIAGCANHNYDFGFKVLIQECNLAITSIETESCTDNGGNNFSATLQVTIDWKDAPTGESIHVSLDGSGMQTIVPSNAKDAKIISFSVPADGSINHQITANFATTNTCGDTITIKYPVPCTADLGSSSGEICTGTTTEIAGTVFEDWDYDGAMGLNDTMGIDGIQVIATDCNGTSQTTYTDAKGNYQFTGLTNGEDYRIEFLLPEAISCWACPTNAGTDNGTLVQFVKAGDCANLGIANPDAYCDSNPFLLTACYVFGNQTTGSYKDSATLISFPYTAGFDHTQTSTDINDWKSPKPAVLATAKEVGTVWGIAWQKSTNTLFSSAFNSYGLGFGPGGTDAIYKVTVDPKTGQATGTPSVFVTLSNFGFTACADPHGGDTLTPPSYDATAFSSIGKCGLGDLEISEDGNTLYVIDLTNRNLVAINANTGALVGTYPIPLDQVDCPDPSGDIRPFALGMKNGELYVGVTCSAESTKNAADLRGYIYRFHPSNHTFTQVLNFPFHENPTYYRQGSGYNGSWKAWISDQSEVGNWTNTTKYSQPWITDIEFYGEDITIGIRDRFGDQWGYQMPNPEPSPNPSLVSAAGEGDIICATYDGISGYILESGGQCGDRTSKALSTNAHLNGAEFYYGDGRNNEYTGGGHHESSFGALLQIGDLDLAQATLQPTGGVGTSIGHSGGVSWLSNRNGGALRAYGLYRANVNPGTTGKANGLGDLEAQCGKAPVEIGNYVWEDINGDGIQDACETGIAGVEITLYNASNQIVAIDTTDAKGQYHFNDSMVKKYTSHTDTTLFPSTTYHVVIGTNGQYLGNKLTLSGTDYTLVPENASSNDQIDSDAKEGTASDPSFTLDLPFITLTTDPAGCANHSYDIGFKSSTTMVIPQDTAFACKAGPNGCDVVVDRILVNMDTTATGVPQSPFIINGLDTTGQFRVEVYYHSRNTAAISQLHINGEAATRYCIKYGTDSCYSDFYAYYHEFSSSDIGSLTITHDITNSVDADDLPGIEVITYRCAGTGESTYPTQKIEAKEFLWVSPQTGNNPDCVTRTATLNASACTGATKDIDITTSVFNIHQDFSCSRQLVFRYTTDAGSDTSFVTAPPDNNSEVTHTITVPTAATNLEVTVCTYKTNPGGSQPAYNPPAWWPSGDITCTKGVSVRTGTIIVEEKCENCNPPIVLTECLPKEGHIFSVGGGDGWIYDVDLSTGDATKVNNTEITWSSGVAGINSLAFDKDNYRFYYIQHTSETEASGWLLGRYDMQTGTHTELGNLKTDFTFKATHRQSHLVFCSGGLFYMVDNTDDLVQITLDANGNVLDQVVHTTGISGANNHSWSGIFDLWFDPADDGTFYLAASDSPGFAKYNHLTGDYEVIKTSGFGQYAGWGYDGTGNFYTAGTTSGQLEVVREKDGLLIPTGKTVNDGGTPLDVYDFAGHNCSDCDRASIPDWQVACGDTTDIEVITMGSVSNMPVLTFSDPTSIEQVLVEAIFRKHSMGCKPEKVFMTSSTGVTDTIIDGTRVEITPTCNNFDPDEYDATVFRSLFTTSNISAVTIAHTGNCPPASITVYVFRNNGSGSKGYSGSFINDFVGICQPSASHTVPIVAPTVDGTVRVKVPATDVNCSRTARLVVNVGGVEIDTTFSGCGNGTDVTLLDLTFENVPAGTDSLSFTMYSIGGSSWMIASVIETETICFCATADAGLPKEITCNTPSVVLEGTNSSTGTAYTYLWSGNSIVSGNTTLTPTINQAGIYTLTVTNTANSCYETAMVTVTDNTTPPTINAGNDETICTGDEVILSCTGGGTYLWSTTDISSTITISPSNTMTYGVTVTGANGCTARDEVMVTVEDCCPPPKCLPITIIKN